MQVDVRHAAMQFFIIGKLLLKHYCVFIVSFFAGRTFLIYPVARKVARASSPITGLRKPCTACSLELKASSVAIFVPSPVLSGMVRPTTDVQVGSWLEFLTITSEAASVSLSSSVSFQMARAVRDTKVDDVSFEVSLEPPSAAATEMSSK
uniref:Uncharacterized protein n=1 Tax=Romanomermis culicivorax TaxID=13658 RepID=A0A915HM63_ROMCU